MSGGRQGHVVCSGKTEVVFIIETLHTRLNLLFNSDVETDSKGTKTGVFLWGA